MRLRFLQARDVRQKSDVACARAADFLHCGVLALCFVGEKMRKNIAWCVVDQWGNIHFWLCASTRKQAIENFLEMWSPDRRPTWKQQYRKGKRCRRIQMKVIK